MIFCVISEILGKSSVQIIKKKAASQPLFRFTLRDCVFSQNRR